MATSLPSLTSGAPVPAEGGTVDAGRHRAWARFRRSRFAVASGAFLLLMYAGALVGPRLVPHGPEDIDLASRLASPSGVHLLGTDETGRDVLARLVYGARVSLTVGLVSVAIAMNLSPSISGRNCRPDVVTRASRRRSRSSPPASATTLPGRTSVSMVSSRIPTEIVWH